jgi:hypothetical protein
MPAGSDVAEPNRRSDARVALQPARRSGVAARRRVRMTAGTP